MHCHTNTPIACGVCGLQVHYGDEAPPSFCGEVCEREYEDNWAECPGCDESFPKDKMFPLVSGETVCQECRDDLPDGTDYDERDQT